MTTPNPQASRGTSHSSKLPVTGVLLVHGYNGCQSDMAEIETALQAYGIVTKNMLLPGHGVHAREMLPLGWEDWAQAVHQEVKLLKQRCDLVFLVGHSLGGALSLHVAAHEEVTGIVSMCAPLYMHPWLKPMVGLFKSITPWLPTLREDVRNREVRRQLKRDIYRWTPLSPVYSMLQFLPQLREELPRITAPALIMTSIYDHVVPARDGREIYRRIGSQEKYLVTFHHSYHMIMVDDDREEVIAKTTAFILRHVSKAELRSRDVDQTA